MAEQLRLSLRGRCAGALGAAERRGGDGGEGAAQLLKLADALAQARALQARAAAERGCGRQPASRRLLQALCGRGELGERSGEGTLEQDRAQRKLLAEQRPGATGEDRRKALLGLGHVPPPGDARKGRPLRVRSGIGEADLMRPGEAAVRELFA